MGGAGQSSGLPRLRTEPLLLQPWYGGIHTPTFFPAQRAPRSSKLCLCSCIALSTAPGPGHGVGHQAREGACHGPSNSSDLPGALSRVGGSESSKEGGRADLVVLWTVQGKRASKERWLRPGGLLEGPGVESGWAQVADTGRWEELIWDTEKVHVIRK